MHFYLRDVLTFRMLRLIDTPFQRRIMKTLGFARQRI